MIDLALILAVIGPLLCAAGALLLAYDVLRGPANWYVREFFGARSWELLRKDHERNLKRLRELPIPPYTEEKISQLISDAEARFNEFEWSGKECLREDGITNLFRSQRLALWGFGLVAAGSIAQSVAAWIGVAYPWPYGLIG